MTQPVRTALSWRRWLDSLRQDALPFSRQLAACAYPAFFWECRPDRSQAFECVLVDSPTLAGAPSNPRPFAEKLTHPVNTFHNLGGDSVLVAPSVSGDFPHLASFLRTAPDAQLQAFWTAVADAVDAWTGPLYLSSSGLGVYWLHVRLDPRPKYFQHRPFRAVSPTIAALPH